MTSPYVLVPGQPDGVLVASVPATCPLSVELPDAGPCRMRAHHLRERKTGPCHAVQVVICRTHGCAFTLYPPGHVPYGRYAVVPVSRDADLLRIAADDLGQPSGRAAGARPRGGAPQRPSERIPWETTQFVAALDAAAGHAWPRDGTAYRAPPTTLGQARSSLTPRTPEVGSVSGGASAPVPAPGRWATQLRWLERSARTLGLSPALPEAQRSRVASLLGLRLLELTVAASCWAGAHGYRALGEVIVEVLGKLAGQPGLPDGLLATGHLSGLWGPPSRWEPGQDRAGPGVLRCPFHGAGTPRPPAPDQPGRVVTTLAS